MNCRSEAPLADLSRQRAGSRKTFAVERRRAARSHPVVAKRDALWRIVRSEEPMFVILVEWNQRRDPACQPGMSRERPVLRQRKFDPPLGLGERHAQGDGASGIGCENCQFHGGCITPSDKTPDIMKTLRSAICRDRPSGRRQFPADQPYPKAIGHPLLRLVQPDRASRWCAICRSVSGGCSPIWT